MQLFLANRTVRSRGSSTRLDSAGFLSPILKPTQTTCFDALESIFGTPSLTTLSRKLEKVPFYFQFLLSHIVQLIQNENNAARFLQRSNNSHEWEKVTDQVARNKVSQLLRSEARSRRHRTMTNLLSKKKAS